MNYGIKRHFCTTIYFLTLIIVCALTLMTPILAFGSINKIEDKGLKKNKSLMDKISFSTELSYTTNSYKRGTISNESGLGVSLTSNYESDLGYNAGIKAELSQEIDKEKITTVEDTTLYLSKALGSINEELSFSSIAYLILPTSKVSRKQTNLETAIILSPSMSYKLDKIGLKHVTYSLALTYGRLFYKYYTSSKGKSNSKYYYKMSHGLTYSPFDTLSLSYGFGLSRSTTYRGINRDIVYGHSFSATTKISKQLSLNIGLENKEKLYKPNGIDSNVKFIDKDSTLYSVGISYNF